MTVIHKHKWLCALILLLTSICCFADAPVWQIVPDESDLSFTATQNNAPVTGQFKKFNGEINFDTNNLSASHVKIIVDTASISDAYNQLADTLKDKDWFNTNLFPQAIFEAKQFNKTGDRTYQAKGTLRIRDKTVPVTINFAQEEYSPNKAKIKGSTTIKRSAFGVGQGEWADTNAIKDDVKIDFTITAVKK